MVLPVSPRMPISSFEMTLTRGVKSSPFTRLITLSILLMGWMIELLTREFSLMTMVRKTALNSRVKIRISRPNIAAVIPVSLASHVMNPMVTIRSSNGFRVPAMLRKRIRRRMDSRMAPETVVSRPLGKNRGTSLLRAYASMRKNDSHAAINPSRMVRKKRNRTILKGMSRKNSRVAMTVRGTMTNMDKSIRAIIKGRLRSRVRAFSCNAVSILWFCLRVAVCLEIGRWTKYWAARTSRLAKMKNNRKATQPPWYKKKSILSLKKSSGVKAFRRTMAPKLNRLAPKLRRYSPIKMESPPGGRFPFCAAFAGVTAIPFLLNKIVFTDYVKRGFVVTMRKVYQSVVW